MPFVKPIPNWEAPGIEPPLSLRVNGWKAGIKPPDEYFNYLQNKAYEALKELQEFAVHKDEMDLSRLVTNQDFEKHLADDMSHVYYADDTGTANAKVVILTPAPTSYKKGLGISFINLVQNTGPVTINVNGLGAKPILKSNGNPLTSAIFKVGSIYTLRYNGTAFILQGEGGEYGTATAGDVLVGTTIGTDEGLVNGSLALTGNATVAQVLAGQTFYNSNAKSKLIGTIPSKAAATITPSTSNQSIGSGQYLSGIQTILGDPDLIAANILKGKNIFGVDGSVDVTSLGGKRFAMGSAVMSSTQYSFEQFFGSAQNQVKLTVAGLGFAPKTVVVYSSTGEARTSVSKDNGVPLHMGYYNVMTKSGMFPLKGHASLDANGFNLPAGQETGQTVFWIAFD